MNVEHEQEPAAADEPVKPVKVGRFLLLGLLVAAVLAASGVLARRNSEEALTRWTDEQAIPTVAIVQLKRDEQFKEIVLPGDLEAYYTALIHGQASGYVREWRTDIGAKVHKGDVLAVLDTPELDQRVTEAEGELDKAKANEALARITADRWKTLRATAAVSEQAIDEKEGDAVAKQAEVSAAQANLERLHALKAFANIVSPFDGVVTSRNVDVGSLVGASASGSQPLFTVSDVKQVRIYVRAPESYGATLHDGMKAKVFVPEYPDRAFDATIATSSHAIDVKSRSLLIELIADNAEGLLTPGSFAQVHFQSPPDPNAVRLPANALLFRDGAVLVALLGDKDRVHLTKVEIARDYGSEVEISNALPPNARVIASPPESIAEGDEVRLADPLKIAVKDPPIPSAEPAPAQAGENAQ
jgi:RND family efflux transporter MFP subunit